MGECIANGTAAGPAWTDWLLNEMRNVRGTVEEQPNGGRWGIIDALPPDVAATVAIKNGWTWHKDNTWNVNCLAIHNDWILAVMLDYPGSKGSPTGPRLCAAVAQQTLRRPSRHGARRPSVVRAGGGHRRRRRRHTHGGQAQRRPRGSRAPAGRPGVAGPGPAVGAAAARRR